MRRQALIGRSLLLILLLSLAACQEQKEPQGKTDSNSSPTSESQSRLVLNNATLEQSNTKGQLLWKIQVDKALYSPDQKKAELNKIRGNLFQDGKIVLQVSADKGEIYKDGENIFLKEKIIATDPRNGAVIRSEEVEWRPKEDVLMVRQNLRGSHAKLEASAKEAKYYTRRQRLELIGNIVATAKDPRLQLKTEHLFWDIPQEKVTSDRPLTMVRYQDKTITDRASANRAEVNLKISSATIRENIEYRSVAPPLQISGNTLTWNYKNRIVLSNQPVRLFHYQKLITITGNQAQVDLSKEVAHLKGGVQGYSSSNQAKLYSREMTWFIPAQKVEAVGNVIYEQAKPKLNLTGERAVGTLQNNNVVVSGNRQDRVVTEIFPD
jgi:LPS export ABC transporter protein LptC